MAARYLSELISPEALAAQRQHYGRAHEPPNTAVNDALGVDECEFLRARDSFYVATISSTGWPYLQHRGGPVGFVRALDAHSFGYADLRGNRQLVTTGNLSASDRAAFLFMDYPRRERLKIIGHARVLDARAEPALAEALSPAPELRSRIERLVIVEVVGFDWNCPAYIAPRFTEAEIERAVAPLRARLAQLERSK